MEAVLKNLPPDTSPEQVTKQLDPFMNVLGITDWLCEKRRNANCAFLTFLRKSDGKKFLDRHGPTEYTYKPKQTNGTDAPVARKKMIAKLQLFTRNIFVEVSKRQLDRNLVSHLKRAHDRQKAKPQVARSTAQSIDMLLAGLSCGHNLFTGSEGILQYSEQSLIPFTGNARFGQQSLVVTLDDESEIRLEISYDTIVDCIVSYHDHDESLTLVLTEPPRFLSRPDAGNESTHIAWQRDRSLRCWPAHENYAAHCLVYRLYTRSGAFVSKVMDLKNRDLFTTSSFELRRQMTRIASEHDFMSSMSSFQGVLAASASPRGPLPFSLIFQLDALVQNCYIHPAIGRSMVRSLTRLVSDCKARGAALPITTDSMKILFQEIPYASTDTRASQFDPEQLIARVVAEEAKRRQADPARDPEYGLKLPEHQVWVFRAMVTPTRLLLEGPDPESKNKILRKFSKYSTYFLRVSFCEDNGQDLPFHPKISNRLVYDRYRAILKQGVKVGHRRFEFLGFSHSSLRSHSAWFSAPFTDENMQTQNRDTMLKSLGSFENIRIVAKCAARIGQAFSETPYAVNIMKTGIMVYYIPDVKSADGSRMFSDGVGKISQAALEEVWYAIPRKSGGSTCVQIRIAGAKGMLALDSTIRGKAIHIRQESMVKFKSNDWTELGICDTSSKPLQLYLNRQMIKILEDMGTKEGWFISMQHKALNFLREVTATAYNTATYLEYQAVSASTGLPRFIRQLDRRNIDYRRDIFLRSVVENTVLRELRLLKHKARIPVPKGVTLFGIMDETGFLNEGEVYVTFQKKRSRSAISMENSLRDGPLIVTRSPALHPGDIQVPRMVTPPEGHPLLALQNCIVFSRKGDRDLPSQLSGGDLDGDLYNVIWDSKARPERVFQAADYPRVQPEELNRDVTRDDIADFFVTFMATDQLGVIANRHQILADVRKEGTLHEDCIKLAELHSTAVDYSKTGIPVDIQELPRAPKTRPDFLATVPPLKMYDVGQIDHIGDDSEEEDDDVLRRGAKHKFHYSEKILGKLYRSIDENKIWREDIRRNLNFSGPSVWEQLLGLVRAEIEALDIDVDYSRHLRRARAIRDMYEHALKDHMWHHSDNPRQPLSEVEAFCGSIMNKRGSQTRRQRDGSIKLKDEVDRMLAFYVKLIRYDDTDETSDDEDGGAELVSSDSSAVERSWACVVAGCENSNKEVDVFDETPLIQSFRVVAAACLMRELENLTTYKAGGFLGVSGGERRVVLPIR